MYGQECNFETLVQMAEQRRATTMSRPALETREAKKGPESEAPRFRSKTCLAMPRPDAYFLHLEKERQSRGKPGPFLTSASVSEPCLNLRML